MDTSAQYDQIAERCAQVFADKARDYGVSWRILRPTSLTDQILIKARRARNLQVLAQQKVSDDMPGEFVGIANYALMAILQLRLGHSDRPDMPAPEAFARFREVFAQAKELMMAKNHDYGEAWREMRVESMTDLILMKLLRVKQIEDNHGRTSVSEGLEANYFDMVNYSVFCLVKLWLEAPAKEHGKTA